MSINEGLFLLGIMIGLLLVYLLVWRKPAEKCAEACGARNQSSFYYGAPGDQEACVCYYTTPMPGENE